MRLFIIKSISQQNEMDEIVWYSLWCYVLDDALECVFAKNSFVISGNVLVQ